MRIDPICDFQFPIFDLKSPKARSAKSKIANPKSKME